MTPEHVISKDVIQQAQVELGSRPWVAYNITSYFLEKGDVYFFKDLDEAIEFQTNNISDYDSYFIINAHSVSDLFRQIKYGNQYENKLDYSSQKIVTMNEKNVMYLKDNLKYMGFGENLYQSLENNIAEGKKEFTLNLDTDINRHPFHATLHFRKSGNTDMYFFNKWEASMNNENNKLQQTFYVNKGQGITLKEGYNLLEGRAVHKELTDKEGQKYQAWLQLDKKEMDPYGNHKINQFHQNYGYDLEKVLSTLPIKELQYPDQKDSLMKSLEKGNIQAVALEKNGIAERYFIEASPQFKSVNVYDQHGSRVMVNNLNEHLESVARNEKKHHVDTPEKGMGQEGTENKVTREAKSVEIKVDNQLKENPKERDLAKEYKETKTKDLLAKKEKTNGLLPKKHISSKKELHL